MEGTEVEVELEIRQGERVELEIRQGERVELEIRRGEGVELEIRQGERVEGILKPVRKVLTEVTEEQHDYRSCLLRRLCGEKKVSKCI